MKRKARGSRRGYRKKTKTSKGIASVVKREINKKIETKSYAQYFVQNFLDRDVRYSNPIYNIAQGTNFYDRVGSKIELTGIDVRVKAANSLNGLQCALHVALIESDWEGTSLNGSGTASDFFSNTGSDPELWRFDRERVKKIHFRKKITVRDSVGTTFEKNGMVKTFKKLNKKYIYNAKTGHGVGTNLYLVYWSKVTGGGLSTQSGTVDYKLYFKDA